MITEKKGKEIKIIDLGTALRLCPGEKVKSNIRVGCGPTVDPLMLLAMHFLYFLLNIFIFLLFFNAFWNLGFADVIVEN